MVGKRLVNTGGAAAAFDPLQNFETVTYTGNGGTQKITGYIRKGAAFNGSSSYINYDSFTFPSNDFTFSAWANTSNVASQYNMITTTAKNGSGFFYLTFEYDKLFYYDSGTTVSLQSSVGSISNNSWYHCLITKSSTDGIKLYLNGTLVDSNSGTTSNTTTSSGENRIGHYYTPTSIGFFNGKIDQVRIFDKALSSSEVTTLYGETYASSTKSTTDIFGDGSGVALYELDEDALTLFKQGVDFNGTATSSRSKILTSGLSTYNDFSISFWMNADDFSFYRTLMGTTDNYSSLAGFGILLGLNSTGELLFRCSNGSSKVDLTKTGLSANTWYHVVITQDSSTTTKKLYVNGTLEDTDTSATIINGQEYSLILGGYGAFDNNPYDGTLDQVRIYSSALDQSDVTNLYRENNIPTTNLVTHYTFDNTYTDQVGSNNGTAYNTTFVNGVYGGTPTNVNFLGMAFQPDLVWIKNRNDTDYNVLYDSVRGAGKFISSNTTAQEIGNSGDLLASFDSNGFTVNNTLLGGANSTTNANNEDFVAWCWKGANSTVSNTDGTITSQVSANQAAGFSIVKYTGGANQNQTVGHGLSAAPELVIVKGITTAEEWWVYANGQNGRLDSTNAFFNGVDSNGGIGTPTSTLISLLQGSNVNLNNVASSGNSFIAYCFHSVDGYQKVGSYTGTGASGNTITTGFQPRFVMIKSTTTYPTSWVMIDHLRDNADEWLYANESSTTFDDANTYTELNSNGFTVNLTASYVNASGHTYIYLAIA